MLLKISSRIMRTTLDLATPVLKELKSLRDREGGSLGSLASRLLAEALTANRAGTETPQELRWETQPMSARVNLADKEAVYRALEGR
jgi:hypothetical protein